jgi:DNA-binding CsgD family transcriptional regulator
LSESKVVRSAAAADSGRLTATELVIADLAARGRRNAEIARELALSAKTVERNLTRIYRKLGVRSRAELLRAPPPPSRALPAAQQCE